MLWKGLSTVLACFQNIKHGSGICTSKRMRKYRRKSKYFASKAQVLRWEVERAGHIPLTQEKAEMIQGKDNRQSWAFSLLLTNAQLNPVTGSLRLGVINLEIRCNFLAVKVIKLCKSLWRKVVHSPLFDLVLKTGCLSQIHALLQLLGEHLMDRAASNGTGRRVTSG